MARTVTTAKQTAATLIHHAKFFEAQAAILRAAASELEIEPPLAEIVVAQESSRKVGIESLTNWVNAASAAAFSARHEFNQSSQKLSVRQTDTPRPKK
jgi:hypothetical protein